jgi:hypothetical protein
VEGRVVKQEPDFVSPVAVLLLQEEAELGEEQQEGQRGSLPLIDGEEDPSVARYGGDDAYLRQPQGFGHQYSVFGLSPTPSAVVGAPDGALVNVENLCPGLQNIYVLLCCNLSLEQRWGLIEALTDYPKDPVSHS